MNIDHPPLVRLWGIRILATWRLFPFKNVPTINIHQLCNKNTCFQEER